MISARTIARVGAGGGRTQLLWAIRRLRLAQVWNMFTSATNVYCAPESTTVGVVSAQDKLGKGFLRDG